MLTQEQVQRYQRQTMISGFGIEGQERLLSSRVLVIGLGGLGSPVAYYLAAAGVGHLGLLDSQEVELSNLQRQILHFTSDLGRLKVDSAANKLRDLNPDIQVNTYSPRLTLENVVSILAGYDLAVDCVDNLATRYIVNDACVKAGIPLVEAGVMGYEGMVTTIMPKEGPCYRCIFPKAGKGSFPEERGPIPVIGALVGMIGCIESMEALKLLLGKGQPLAGRLLIVDGYTMGFREITVHRNPHCTACGA